MSTQKDIIKDPKKARRSLESVLAEAIIVKHCGWNIEFVSGGYGGFSKNSLLEVLKNIKIIYGKKLWLNIGILNETVLTELIPYLEGICAAIETTNPEIHAKVCPSKPVEPYLKMYEICDKLGLKKAMTIILGLGETIEDFESLEAFIKKHGVTRITFYGLNPIKGTVFEGKEGPKSEYFAEWISKTRIAFPEIVIIAGVWVKRISDLPLFLKAGANSITKFPVIKLFNTKYAKDMASQSEKAGRKFLGNMTELPKIDIDKEIEPLEISEERKPIVKQKVEEYLKIMMRD